jgi:hypothetical protein
MVAHLHTTSRRLATGLLILVVLISTLAEPLTTWAKSLSIPAKCASGSFTLISGESTITIENATASSVNSLGCNISGNMRVRIRGNDEGNIPIRGQIDAYNHFTSDDIGQFDLQIAGLTLVVKGSSYAIDTLYLTQPWIKIPDSWGGLSAPIPQTMKIDADGLEAVTFKLPSLQSEKGFKLDLQGSLGLVSGGYQIKAKGDLGLPDIGKTKDCSITVEVTLVADVFGQAVMFIHTPDGAETVSLEGGRSEIASPVDQQALVPAAMALRSYYLPVPDTLPYEVLVQIQNREPLPGLDAQAASEQPAQPVEMGAPLQAPVYGPPAPSNPASPAGGGYLAQSADGAMPVLAPSDPAQVDLSAYYASLPWQVEAPAASPLGVGVIMTASAQCGKGIPIDGTGFELTGVEGTLSLRPESEFVRLKVVFKSSLKVADTAALTAEAAAMFQWNPEFALSLNGKLTVLDMFNVGEATISVSESDGFRTTVLWNSWFIKASLAVHAWNTTSTYCSAWTTRCYNPYPLPPICGTTCSDWGTIDKFHFTGSASCRLGLAKGELWSGCVLPYPCNFHWCHKWFIYYPCWNWCWACIDIPPFDIWLAGAGAEFGEFTGDRWGLKGYVSFLGFTTGFYVDNHGDLDLGDVSGYKLVDSEQMARARQAWLAAQQGGSAAALPLDDAFTFLADDQMLVHFDLPLADARRLPLAPGDLISSVQVITQTDTIFSVKTDIPLTVTMVSPEGVEITPDNYDLHPGGYQVEYSQVMTYEQKLAPSSEVALEQARLRFIPASGDPSFEDVDVLLDATAVFTNVSLGDTSVDEFRYVPVEPGAHTLLIQGVEGAQLAAGLNIITGTDTTVMTIGSPDAQLMVLHDDNRPPSEFGYGRLRLVNAAPNADPVDVGIGDFAIPDLPYATASDYLEIPAGAYSLSLATADFDPLEAITLTGEITSVAYGIKVASAGDVNGDGYDDVLVADNAFDEQRGKVYLYLGSPAGLAAEPAWTKAGENSAVPEDYGDQFGSAVASAGDVNGDGYDDVIVGAIGFGSNERGKAYLYLGSQSGLSSTEAWSKTGVGWGREYGAALAGAGDVNGDGYDDVLVGAPDVVDSSYVGEAYLYFGNPDGISAEPDWTVNQAGDPYNAFRFGAALAGAGDVNHDGYADVIVGAPGIDPGYPPYNVPGKVFLYLGSAGGPSTSPDWVAEAETSYDQFGLALAGVGDLNGDGYDDVVVGAPYYTDPHSPGKIYVYQGSPAGLATTAAWTAQGDDLQTHLGSSVAGPGDVNGDGLDDFFVGAYTAFDLYGNLGKIYLFNGSPNGAYGSLSGAWMASGRSADDYFGVSVAGAGDVNGDGYADLIAGALGSQGRARVYFGGMGLPPVPLAIQEGDIQTLYAANVGQNFPLAVMNTSDEVYRAITETRYVVDQATTGTWSVGLEGDTSAASNLTVGAISAYDPPILEDLQVDASNLSETLVSWRLLSDYLPVTIHIFANDGPITQTMVITEPLPAVETIPVFEGIEVATIPINESLAVKAALVTTTVDLSFLESGNYRLWVRVEDGVSPPVQGYVWNAPTFVPTSAPAALNRVRVAAQGYDSQAQASGAAEIHIDHSASFGQSWTSTITPTINPKYLRLNSQGQLEEEVIDGLFVEFTPYDHPDVDSYLLEISSLAATQVITAGNNIYFHYNEAGEPVGNPVNYAIFNGLNPKTAYTIRLGAQDLDSQQIAWSQAQVITVPMGDFSIAPVQDVIEVPAGAKEVNATLLLTMTADLFSSVSIYLDGSFLPPGVSIREISYQPLTSAPATAYPGLGGVPSPAYLPSALDGAAGLKATSQDKIVMVHLALSLPASLPKASYLLPFVAYSGELVKNVSVRLRVGSPQTILVDPNSAQITYLNADLPLPTCATAIRLGVSPGTFSAPALLSFEQGSSNVANWQGMPFARVHFVLQAVNASSGAALQPGLPVSIELEYDPACLAGVYGKGIHLRAWSQSPANPGAAGWSDDGIACQPGPVRGRLSCGLDLLGEFALFEPVRRYFPVIRN